MVQVTHAKALFDCVGDEESELTFREGDILIDVRETSEEGWLHGRLERTGDEGLFPDNYVEIMNVEVETPLQTTKLNDPPQLPIRSQVNTSKNIIPTSATSIKLDTVNNRTGTSTAPAKAALPGLGSQSMYGSFKPDVAASQSQNALDLERALSGPPALPKRINTFHESSSISASEQTPESTLSVRERMANLSLANQRQISSLSAPSSTSQPAPLPPRPAVKEQGQLRAFNTAHSSLSPAARPALPPRSGTAESSPSNSSAANSTKHEYQVKDAAVPVPKLTTFARPRSSRTGKSSGSLTQKEASPSASATENLSPPKLPSRPVSTVSSNNSNVVPVGKAADATNAGPVRFSPTVAKQSPVNLNSGLPAISRNAQPLALPSRTNLSPSPALSSATKFPQVSLKSITPGSVRTSETIQDDASQDSNVPAGSAFGVKLNSVGSRTISVLSAPATDSSASESTKDTAPPLPARSSTIPYTPSSLAEGPVTPSMRLQKDSNRRSFSPSASNAAQINRDHQIATALSNHAQFPHNPQSIDPMEYIYRQQIKTSSGTRVAMPPPRLPEATAQEPIGVKPNARRRYEALFLSVAASDYIEGAKVHAIYVRSRLDSKTLAQIWDMVDVDNSGRLSRAQFCMGLYLIDERLASGLIPLEQVQRPAMARVLRSATTSYMFKTLQQERTFISPSRVVFAESAQVEKGVQQITDLFMTARDELEYAEEARGTVYYNDDKETARGAVQECLTSYDELLKDLDDAQKLDVQRKIGLKIMELKSQLDALNAEELE
ncbi:hypothetical protein BGX27_010706 [Mortierella sp. AM989]|nr:hypothetical protein BGX27_010706 [Mortierella sp. AM989]